MADMRKHLTVDLIVDVISGADGDPASRAALADLLEEAGRSDEAALVRSGRPIKPEWPDKDDYASIRVVAGQWRSEEQPKPDSGEGDMLDLFAGAGGVAGQGCPSLAHPLS